MIKTLEIILGYVEKPVAVGAAATSLTDQYNSDKSGFVLVNQSAQTGAAVPALLRNCPEEPAASLVRVEALEA